MGRAPMAQPPGSATLACPIRADQPEQRSTRHLQVQSFHRKFRTPAVILLIQCVCIDNLVFHISRFTDETAIIKDRRQDCQIPCAIKFFPNAIPGDCICNPHKSHLSHDEKIIESGKM